jgi:hypothetical protein
VPGDVNASSNVVNTGAAWVPVTNTVYVLLALNDGENPVRLVVDPADRTASCGFALLTPVHELAAPNAMLLLPVPTVPFSAISSASAPVAALKNRTVVSSVFPGPVESSSSSLQPTRTAALASARMAVVMRREYTEPPDNRKNDPGTDAWRG